MCGRGRRADLGVVPGEDALQAGWESDSGWPGAQRDTGILAARLRERVMRAMRVIKAVGEAHLSHSNAILDSGLGFSMFWGRNSCIFRCTRNSVTIVSTCDSSDLRLHGASTGGRET